MFVADSGTMQGETWVRTFSQMAAELPSICDWSLEFEEGLRGSLAEPGWKTHKQTRAFARFCCSKCGHSWPSNHVLIFFRIKLGYPCPQKGSVKMYIFRQKCEKCRMFCDATFTQQNIQITLENLLREIRKQCYGEWLPGSPRDLNAEVPATGPHENELCEACIIGVCPVAHPEVITPLQPEKATQPEKSVPPALNCIYYIPVDTRPWKPPTTKENRVAMLPEEVRPQYLCFCLLVLIVCMEFVLTVVF